MQAENEICQKRQCRSCLSIKNELLHIFKEGYRDILAILSGVQVTPQDRFPKYVCVNCIAILKKFIEFRETCKRSYEYLKRQHIDNNEVEPTESLRIYQGSVKLETNESHSPELKIEFESTVTDLFVVKPDRNESNLGRHITNHVTGESRSIIDRTELAEGAQDDVLNGEGKRESNKLDGSVSCDRVFNANDSSDIFPGLPVKKGRKVRDAVNTRVLRTGRKCKDGGARIVKKKVCHMDSVDQTKIKKSRLSMEEQKAELVKKSQSKEYLDAPYKCQDCFKYFLYEDNFDDHIRTRHNESIGPHLCTLCNSRFKAKGTLTSHAYKHSVIYRCLACGVTYKKFISAKEHYKIAHEGAPPTHVCHLCGKISKSSHAESRHMKLTHSEAALVRIQCSECPATFVEKNHYKAHMRYHSDVKPFKCDVCGNAYHFKDTMLKHRLMHSDEKNFYCAECDLSYRCRRFLDKHLKDSLRHGGKRQKFNCGICRTSFTVQSEMFKHKEKEHGVVFKPKKKPTGRNHQCDTCGKVFSTNVTLKSHLRTHTGERPFSCETCGRAFTQRSAMQTHVKLVHLNMKWSELVKRKAKNKTDNTEEAVVPRMSFYKIKP